MSDIQLVRRRDRDENCFKRNQAHVALVAFAATMSAQQIGSPTLQQGVTPPRGTFVIRNARIVTVSGADIENGSIVIRDGKIEAVGATVSAPAGCANDRRTRSVCLSGDDRRRHEYGSRRSTARCEWYCRHFRSW